MSGSKSTLLRVRVDTDRLRKAEQVFQRLGMTTEDAINVFLAQVALKDDLPFSATGHPERFVSDREQAANWSQALGEY